MKTKQPIYRIVILIAVVFAVYGQILFSSFHFDDRSSILENPALKSRSGILINLWQYWPTRFLTTVSFFLNYRAGGINSSGYHLVDIIIHIINSILLYFLIKQSKLCHYPTSGITKHPVEAEPANQMEFLAWMGALLFALHPLQTQAVSYIAQRATTLAAGFYLASLLFYIRGRNFYLLSWFLGALSMFCKEMAITLPLAIILWDVIFVKKSKRRRWPRLLAFGLLLLIIPAIILLNPEHPKYNDSGQISFRAGEKNFKELLGGIKAPDRREYALTQTRVLVTYLRLIILPFRQNLDYDYPIFFFFLQYKIVVSSLIILSLIIISYLLMKKKKIMGAFGIFFFFLALLPESSLIPIRDVIFEHRLYLPLVGMAFLFTELVALIPRNKVPVTALLIFFSLLTLNRNRIWRDESTLWEDTVKKSPGKARPYNNLGYIYNQQGLYRKALDILSRANEIDGEYPEALLNLAISHEHLGQIEEAEEACRKALQIKSDYPEAYNCRGDILRLRGRPGEAEKAYLRALELNPRFSEARNNLANLYQEMGKGQLALRQYRKALQTGEENPTYLNNLGLHYLKEGDIDSAIKTFRRALALDERLHQAHYNLGNALFEQGDLNRAVDSYRRALRLKPDYVRAYLNLGITYSQMEEWDKALESFLKVTELEPDSASAHLKTGLIYALYRKQPGPASQHLRKALELEPDLPQREKIEELIKKIKPPRSDD